MTDTISSIYDGSLYTSLLNTTPVLLLIPLSVAHLVVCFILMGVLSSDFLANNINSLCDSSGILITILLSLCNSSPDIISNFVAWSSYDDASGNTDSLAFSEVLGACGTIICVAQGLVFISIGRLVKKSTSNEEEGEGEDEEEDSEIDEYQYEFNNLLQKIVIDLLFFWVAMFLMIVCVLLKKISIITCIFMLLIYVSYLYMNYREHKSLQRKSSLNMINVPPVDIQLDDYTFRDTHDINKEEELVRLNYTHPNFLENIDYSFFLQVLENSSSPPQGKDATDDVERRIQSAPTHDTSFDTIDDTSISAQSEPLHFKPYSDIEPNGAGGSGENVEAAAAAAASAIPTAIVFHEPNPHSSLQSRNSLIHSAVVSYWEKFQRKKLYKKIILVLNTPFLILITLTCPRLEKSLPLNKFKFWVLILQCFMSPAFTVYSIAVFASRFNYWVVSFVTIPAFLVLSSIQLVMFKQINDYNKLSFHTPSEVDHEDEQFQGKRTSGFDWVQEFKFFLKTFATLGIVNSIIWIVILANNLIGIIQYYQEITHISESILGLTFFAWGNSIADILSNLAILKLYSSTNNKFSSLIKFSAISIGSCIGGCLINTMIGVGFNCLIAIALNKQGKLDVSSSRFTWKLSHLGKKTMLHLCISSVVIIGTVSVLIGLAMFLLSQKQRLSPKKMCARYLDKIGFALIALWIATTLLNVLIEIFM